MSLNQAFTKSLEATIEQLKADKVYKRLNYLDSPQSARVQMEGRGEVLILSSNNYLGLCDEPSVDPGGHRRTAHVRRGHGERALHLRHVHDPSRARGRARQVRRLRGVAQLLSAWNANEGFTATVAQEGDFIVSDALNHASIIDSMRLAKAISKCTTAVYKHGDMDDLRAKLVEAKGAKRRMIWTDGIFSMEGAIAKLPDILQIARDHDAIVVRRRLALDRRARQDGARHRGALRRARRSRRHHVDARQGARRRGGRVRRRLGGARGYLTQRSRPQLFSNALPPTVAMSALAAVRYRRSSIRSACETLRENTRYFREQITEAGFKPLPGETPIVPIIVGETAAAIRMSDMLLDEGVFVTGFGFPVVPHGQARVRCQISAGHTRDDLDQAIRAFKTVGSKARASSE